MLDASRHRAHGWWVLYLIAAIPLIGTIMVFWGTERWPLALLSHFPLQWLLACTALAVAFALGRRWVPLGLCLFAALLNLWQVLPYVSASNRNIEPWVDSRLRIASINVSATNSNTDAVRGLIERYEPDVLLLIESTPMWLDSLSPALSAYENSIAEPKDGYFGIALYSKPPLSRGEVIYLGQTSIPAILAELELSGSPIGLLGVHLDWPLSLEAVARRNRQLSDIPEVLQKLSGAQLVIGDMNLTPWSSPFRNLLLATKLRDTGHSAGLQGTWPSLPYPFSIPIDHCLISEHLRLIGRHIGPNVGSDHYPLIVDIGLELRTDLLDP